MILALLISGAGGLLLASVVSFLGGPFWMKMAAAGLWGVWCGYRYARDQEEK